MRVLTFLSLHPVRLNSVKFLGSLPVDTELVTLLDAAEHEALQNGSEIPEKTFDLPQRYQKTATAPRFTKVVDEIVAQLGG